MTPEATDWRAVCLLVGGGVTAAMHMGKVAIALPALLDERSVAGVTPLTGAWLLAVPGLVGAIGAAVVGLALSGATTVHAFRWALLVAALASLAGGAVGTVAGLIACRVVEAVAGLVVMVAAPVLVGRVVAARDTGVAMGIWSCYMPVGQGVVLLLGPVLLLRGGWSTLWNATAIVSLVLAVICLGWLRAPALGRRSGLELRRTSVSGDGAPLRTGGTSNVVLLAGVFGFYTLQWIAVASYLPTLLTDHGLSLRASGAVAAVVVLVNVVGNVAAGRLGRRSFRRTTVLALSLAVMGACGVLLFLPSIALPVRIASAVAFSAVGGVVPGTLFGLVAEVVRLAPGFRNGLLIQGSQIGSALGPLIVGAAAATTGDWATGSQLIGGATVAALAFLRLSTMRAGAGSRSSATT